MNCDLRLSDTVCLVFQHCNALISHRWCSNTRSRPLIELLSLCVCWALQQDCQAVPKNVRVASVAGGAGDELVLWFFVFFLFVYNLPTGEVFVVFFRRRDCCCLATIRPFRSLYFTQYHCLLQPASHPTTNTRVSIKLTHATP